MGPAVRTARVYDPPGPGDGVRVLVDRLWPRGMSRQDAPFERWCKQVAPSSELRSWYGHDPAKFEEFSARYRTELETGEERMSALAELADLCAEGPLTLLTATRDVAVSHAAVLADLLGTCPAAGDRP